MKNKLNILSIVFYVAITIVPLLLGFGYSLLNSFGLAGLISDGFTTSNWIQTFTASEFFYSIGYSLILTMLIVIISLTAALFLNNQLKYRILSGSTSYIFYIPLAIPLIVASFISYQLLGQSGFFSRIAFQLNFINDTSQFMDLVNDEYNFGIIFTHVIVSTIFFSILFANIFKNHRLEEMSAAAKTLGANKKYIYRRIIMPVILTKSVPAIVLYSIFILGSYEIPLLLGRQDPQMVSVTIARKFQQYNLSDLPVAYCMAVLYTIIIVFVLLVLYRNKKLYHENI